MCKALKILFLSFLIFNFLISYSYSFEDKKADDFLEKQNRELIVNKWFSYLSNTTEIVTFRKDNTFETSITKVDIIAGEERKRENLSAKGKWQVNKDHLIIEVTESQVENIELWKKSNISFFKIEEISKNSFHIISTKGLKKSFFSSPIKINPQDYLFAIPLEPFVVNFKQTEWSKYPGFLCIFLKLILSKPIKLEKKLKIPEIHPRIREGMLFYLSSLGYEDIYNFDKVKYIEKDIYKILKLYSKEIFSNVEVTEIAIFKTYTEVESFLLKHPPIKKIIEKKITQKE